MPPLEAPPSDNIYVTDLPADLDDQELKEIFSSYGVVTQCRVLSNSSAPGGQAPKKAGLVRFQSVDEAAWVVENLHGNIPQGLDDPIGVRFADTPQIKAQRAQGKGQGNDWRSSPYGHSGGYDGWQQDGYWEDAGSQNAYIRPKKGDAWGEHTPAGKGYGPAANSWGKGKTKGKEGKEGKMGKGKNGKDGKDGKGYTGQPSTVCTIKVLHDGLLEAMALPGGTGWTNDENALYVANLPADTTDLDLYRIFAPFGAIAPKGVRAMLNEDRSCRGIGFVNFLDPMAAQAAVQTLNGTWLPDGTTLTVREKAPAKGGKGSDKGKGSEKG